MQNDGYKSAQKISSNYLWLYLNGDWKKVANMIHRVTKRFNGENMKFANFLATKLPIKFKNGT